MDEAHVQEGLLPHSGLVQLLQIVYLDGSRVSSEFSKKSRGPEKSG
jgi:hypothetical protein